MDVPGSPMLILGAQSEHLHMRVSDSTFIKNKGEILSTFKSGRCRASRGACLAVRISL